MAEHIRKRERPRSNLAALRKSTRHQHEDLHVHPLLCDLVSDELTVSSYRKIIEAFYGFYQPFEPQLIAAAARLGCSALYDHAVRTGWLQQDLVRAGYSMAEIELLNCHPAPLPRLTRGSLAGYLYVIEGSNFGGQRIVDALAGNGKLEPLRSARFFEGYREETIPRWHKVCGFIETTCQSASEKHAAFESARSTFDSLAKWLTFIYFDGRRIAKVDPLGAAPGQNDRLAETRNE